MTPVRKVVLVVSWLWVGAPFAYGLYELTLRLRQLFTG
ncbi:MFS transporter small subunit [Streptomyces roseoverticillatus]